MALSIYKYCCFLALTAFSIVTLSSCEEENSEWVFAEEIDLGEVGIIGIEYQAESDLLWVSDGDNNRLLKVRRDGSIAEEVEIFRRPMHLSYREGVLYVAEYGADRVVAVSGEDRIAVPLPQFPDSPAGVDVKGDRMAIADFYGQQIILIVGEEDRTFGTEGSGPGEFHYPTHVRFQGDKLFVADAYNHRVQVFDSENNHLLSIGERDDLDAATGLFVDEESVFVTDFENHRLLIYKHEGELQQIIAENLKTPTAVVRHGNELFVANYQGRSISVFRK